MKKLVDRDIGLRDRNIDTILDQIVKEKRKEVNFIKKTRNSLKVILEEEKLTLIAEIKKASPSKGIICPTFNPERQLDKYIKSGSDAVSILTDEVYFQGSNEIFKNLRVKTDVPLLRKDFIIDQIQIYESFFIGADIVLLIANILSKKELKELITITHSLGMEALVEVHDFEDLYKSIESNAEIIGINNRNLNDFSVNLNNTASIVEEIEKNSLRDKLYIVAESGIKDKEDIIYLRKIGVDGVLIGECLMRASDPMKKIEELFS